MHYTTSFLCLLSTGALAFPTLLDSRQQDFSYNGPIGPAHACPTTNPHTILDTVVSVQGAPPNYPNYACIPMSSAIDEIGINLFLSNSSALQVYSDDHCANRISYILWPQSLGEGNNQFCAKQSDNGGLMSWKSVMYAIP